MPGTRIRGGGGQFSGARRGGFAGTVAKPWKCDPGTGIQPPEPLPPAGRRGTLGSIPDGRRGRRWPGGVPVPPRRGRAHAGCAVRTWDGPGHAPEDGLPGRWPARGNGNASAGTASWNGSADRPSLGPGESTRAAGLAAPRATDGETPIMLTYRVRTERLGPAWIAPARRGPPPAREKPPWLTAWQPARRQIQPCWRAPA